MDKKRLIVILLIIAVLFSVASILMNLTLKGDFTPVRSTSQSSSEGTSGGQAGNVNLVINEAIS